MTEASPWIVDVDAATFQREVLDASLKRPVLVDFWAEWCEPCKTLGPLLEARAREGGGRFLLARVNIDQSPELAQALRVQGIPAVFAVVRGQLVDGFEGALPAERLDAFLERVAPGGPPAEGGGDPVERARALAAGGDRPGAIALLEERLGLRPGEPATLLALGDLLIDEGLLERAAVVIEDLPEDARGSREARALADRLAFATSGTDLRSLRAAVVSDPADFDARLELGKALIAAKEFEAGLEELLEAVKIDPETRGKRAKAAMLETFELLGLEDPIANDYRFKLSLELFA